MKKGRRKDGKDKGGPQRYPKRPGGPLSQLLSKASPSNGDSGSPQTHGTPEREKREGDIWPLRGRREGKTGRGGTSEGGVIPRGPCQ